MVFKLTSANVDARKPVLEMAQNLFGQKLVDSSLSLFLIPRTHFKEDLPRCKFIKSSYHPYFNLN